MLISHQARCIFVHVQKTGGTTVEAVLRAHLPDAQYLGFKHDPAAWHRAAVPEWDRYFKFAFVRNPWDRLVSWHTMMLVPDRRTGWERWRGRGPRNRLWRYVRAKGRRFEDYVRHCTDVIDDHDGRKCCAWDQVDYFTAPDGASLVDFVGRFEHFEQDLRGVLDRPGAGQGRDSAPGQRHRPCALFG